MRFIHRCLIFLFYISLVTTSLAFSKKLNFSITKTNDSLYSLSLEVPKGWHLYAPNDEKGLPLSFEETISSNILSYTFQWPKSQPLPTKNGVSQVYKKNITIPIILTKKNKNNSLYLSGTLSGALCKNICVPFSFPITIGKQQNLFEHSFLFYVLLAFLGGFILNFMPCVWPVLLAKLRSIIGSTLNIKKRSFLTFFGIICFFNTLSLLGATFHSASKPFLWGSHFQNPYFLLFLTLVMGISSLAYMTKINLFSNFQTFGNYLLKFNKGHDFYLGFLAGILASPCTAPFLTTALAFSIGQSPWYLFILFNAIAIGYGLPYLIIIFFPSIINLLPKPGKWLLSIEKTTGIILLVFSVWFGYLSYLSLYPSNVPEKSAIGYLAKSYPFPAENLEPLKIPTYLSKGKKIFVITSAPWCITCKYNEHTVFSKKKVIAAFSNPNTIVMIGIWKKNNKMLESYLIKTKSLGIPSYHVYTEKNPKGIRLSELPSQKEILSALES